MVYNRTMYDNSFEKFPGEAAPTESEIRAKEWQDAMSSDDVPAFAGDVSMNQESTTPSGDSLEAAPQMPIEDALNNTENNQGLSNAAAIINYGLNAAAKEYGVETVVQKIKSFDPAGSENPIRDFFLYLGIDTPSEINDVRMEREAARFKEADFYENSDAAPQTKKRSPEGAFQAIEDMKELILEVEGADPRYEQLREEAKAAGKGYFEYAVGSRVNRGLTDLFDALAAEPKAEENLESLSPEATSAQPAETPDTATPDNPIPEATPWVKC